MKELFFILFVMIFYGCTSKNDEIESIEVITYYYDLNDNQSKLMLDCLFYSKTNNDGYTEILRQILPSSQREVGYEYPIDKQLISRIQIKTKSSNEKTFDAKLEKTTIKLYCGPIIRFRVKHKSGKTFSFVTDESIMKSDKKIEVFYTFYKAVIQNAKTNNFNNVQMKDIKNKQKEFEKFIIREDSLHHSFPPLPKKSRVKFIKP